MNTGTALANRDSEILQALALRLRCIGVRQVAGFWWLGKGDAVRSARARLRQLEKSGLIQFASVLARPLPAFDTPIVSWVPGDATPDFAPIAYHLKHRFTRPVASTQIVFASKLSANRFGGLPGRVPRRAEATHDLGLASVFLRMLQETPERAHSWVAESQLLKEKSIAPTIVPDAIVRSRRGKETIIEFGGEYPKSKLAKFHEDCARRERGYELW